MMVDRCLIVLSRTTIPLIYKDSISKKSGKRYKFNWKYDIIKPCGKIWCKGKFFTSWYVIM